MPLASPRGVLHRGQQVDVFGHRPSPLPQDEQRNRRQAVEIHLVDRRNGTSPQARDQNVDAAETFVGLRKIVAADAGVRLPVSEERPQVVRAPGNRGEVDPLVVAERKRKLEFDALFGASFSVKVSTPQNFVSPRHCSRGQLS